MLETPPWCGRGPLLSRPPLLYAARTGVAATLVAALSETGRQAAFEHGIAACATLVAAQCLDERAAAGREVHWYFVERALIADLAALDAHLATVLASGHAPRQPNVLDRTERGDRAEYLLQVPRDLVWFDGHFPGAPVLPGVVQADWAIYHGRALGFGPDRFRGFPRLKFKAVIRPDAVLRLALRRRSENRLEFSYASAAALHSAGSIEYAGRA
ncbi:MAG TPA: hypothetical protein VM616_00545 [Gammaproteobacteria bacterium]|nr:hypothetical protein [Gammaproteobacteria bacterium]